MKPNDEIRRDDPASWINRPMNDYYKIKDDLCVTAGRFPDLRDLSEKYITDSKEGMTLILCRYIRQGSDELTDRIRVGEGRSWNVPVSAMISTALSNMPLLFPARITDTDTGRIIPLKTSVRGKAEARPEPVMYSFETVSASIAAEENDAYENESSSRLKFIVNASPAVGEALLFYPGLLNKIGEMVGRDPLIMSAAPGKLYIFDSESRRNSLNAYLKHYMERFGTASFDPRMYKYYRINRVVYDITPVSTSCANKLKNAHIPQGSVASAWGDVDYRCRILDMNRSRYDGH